MRLHIFYLSILTCFFISCTNYLSIDKRKKNVQFHFNTNNQFDSDYEISSIYYQDLNNINIFTNKVIVDTPVKHVKISRPTVFFIDNKSFLIYPGEKIEVINSDEKIYLKSNKGKTRNKELNFFINFEDTHWFPINEKKLNPSMKEILIEDEKFNEILKIARLKYSILFDSMIVASGVSRKFRVLVKEYLIFYDLNVPSSLEIYRDSFLIHNLFDIKMRQSILSYNNIGNVNSMRLHSTLVNQFFYQLFGFSMRKANAETFYDIRDSIVLNFKSITKDYLLTQLYYYALSNNMSLAKRDIDFFNSSCNEKTYKRIISKYIKQENAIGKLLKKDNVLISPSSKITSIESLIQRNKGKVIFIDFWATWCSPCIQELPFLNQRMLELKDDNIVFFNISIDKQRHVWDNWVFSNSKIYETHYLLVDPLSNKFVKENKLETIPRYMVIDEKGVIINNDFPAPSDNNFSKLLRNILN